jgi:hypothetical protein
MDDDPLKSPEKLMPSGGRRYKLTRRPELYADILGLSNQAKEGSPGLKRKKLSNPRSLTFPSVFYGSYRTEDDFEE